jgi:PAS domain S-box-containing protein
MRKNSQKDIIMTMKNLDASERRSITKGLTLGLIITLLVVAGFSLGINYIFSSRKATAELEQKADEYILALTDTLRRPLWTYNEEMIKAIGNSFAQNEFIAQLIIKGEDGTVFFKMEMPDEPLLITKSEDIVYGKDLLGRVDIGLASGYYFALGRQLFMSSSLTILFMIAALLVMTGLLLRQFLNKPMSSFIDMVHAYATGHSDAFKKGTPYKEFFPLVNVLNEMGDKLESQMRSLQLTQHAVDRSSVEIYWIDLDAHITYANDAAVQDTGYSKEELEQMSLTDIEHNLSNEFWQERFEELKKEGSLTFESIHLRKDHSTFPVQITATFLEFANNEYIFAFVTDITKRKQAEEEIKELAEFEKFSKLAVGREKIMIGLKEEINELLRRLNKQEKYKIVT